MGKKMEQVRKQQGTMKVMVDKTEENIEGFYADVQTIVQECRKEALSQLETLKQRYFVAQPDTE